MNEPNEEPVSPMSTNFGPTKELLEQALGLAAADPEGDSPQRWECVYELCQRATPEVFEAAAGWCADSSSALRMLGADVLGQLGHTEDSGQSPYAEHSLPVLLGMLEDDDAGVLQSAIVALGHLGSWGVSWDCERLRAYASHADADVRQAVAFSLGGQLCDESASSVEMMLELMQDEESMVRDWATFGLGVQSDADTPAVREVLVERLQDVDDEVRCNALVSLAKRKDEQVVSLIAAELEQDEVSGCAVEAAGEFGRPEFSSALQALLEANPEDEDISEALARCRDDS